MQRRAPHVVNNEDLGLGRTMGPSKFDYLILSTIVWFTNFAITYCYSRLYMEIQTLTNTDKKIKMPI